ncbi:MAG: hypothetical protein M1393_04360 [Candidatus Thermoplasmatota archaeon]|nr:hypothetical protein [Candidatus Thermoplasmatota archaeon]
MNENEVSPARRVLICVMGLATCRKTQAKQVMPVRDQLKSDRRTGKRNP